MKVGYARVSTKEQNEARQIKAFEELKEVSSNFSSKYEEKFS